MRRTTADQVRFGRGLAPAAGAFLGRTLEASFVVIALASLVFFALRLLPGDAARLVLGDQATEADLARVRASLHLDRSLGAQYLEFVRGLLTLHLGDSIRRPGTGAMTRVVEALQPTAALAGLGVSLGACAGVGVAILASGPWLGRRARQAIDRALIALAATPLVAFAPLVTWALAVRLRVVPLPGDPEAGFAGLVFAASLLAMPLAAHVGRIARAALSDLGRAQFLTVAQAKGAPPSRIWFLHALPAVVGPIVTVVATQLGALLGGAVVLERMFERRGLGTLILEAYSTRDLPVLEGAVVAAGFFFVAAQIVGTLIHMALDPRTRGMP